MTLPGVPGIIDGSMTVTTEPDGRLSLRVLIGAHGDILELIINPEHLSSTLGVDAPAAVVPCHIGFFRNAA
jgi:hypothetical protein